MIRTIREGSSKYPWILKGLIMAIAVTFVIGMGWFGYESSQPNTVATIGPYKISKDEYLRTKQGYYRFYREQLKQEEIQEETINILALEGLLSTKLWQLLADELNLAVSPQELHDAIVKQKDFQKDGTFDAQYYQRLLAANRMTPHQYEQQRRTELLAEKARLVVSEATTLTPAEMQEVKDLAARQALEGTEPDPMVIEQLRTQFLLQKKQQAMQAVQASLRARRDVNIHEELL